ncbi:catalase-related peroxidase [Shewanella sairae]|uniref:Catalase-related peroxidase n=1 Tax=Shewanella sairae TaxID=190310 RepID=A0ABQ4PHR4_9GAMM|nr:catalase family peroxidase [Shewanella sairae]MCL1131292.1 catalase family peroxidase [Shewanella sairae]GIU47061.1 catalase-related peroxidase [Shewanella sairae]
MFKKRLYQSISPLLQASIYVSLALLPTSIFAAEKSISELVDAVNGTPDAASREAGKKIKLRNHAKGFCTSGTFTPAANIENQFNIPFFEQQEISVTARFSLGGTNPHASDKGAGRFMSLKIDGDKESLNFVTTNAQLFFASNLEDFFTFQTKVKQGAEGKQWLIDNKPDAKAFFEYVSQMPKSSSFANSRYFGVNSFLFDKPDNSQIAGRWIFEPAAGQTALTQAELATRSDDFLQQELLNRIETAPAVWNLYVKLADSDDVVVDPTILWPESRQRILVGQIIIDGKRDNESNVQQCDKSIFNPVLLPEGIEPSADPILNARTPAYIKSFIRRL